MCNGKQLAVFILSFLGFMLIAWLGGINFAKSEPLIMAVLSCFALACVLALCPWLMDAEEERHPQGE